MSTVLTYSERRMEQFKTGTATCLQLTRYTNVCTPAPFLHITGMTFLASKWRGAHFHFGQLQENLLGELSLTWDLQVVHVLSVAWAIRFKETKEYSYINVCHNACAQFLVPTKRSYVWEWKTTKRRNELYGSVLVQLAPNIPDFYGIKLCYRIRRRACCTVRQLNPVHALRDYSIVHFKTFSV